MGDYSSYLMIMMNDDDDDDGTVWKKNVCGFKY